MLWSGFNSGIPNFHKQTEPIELSFYPLCMPLKQLCLVSHFLLHFFVSKQTSFLLCSSPRRYFNVLTPHGVKSQSPIIYLSVNSWNEQQQSCYITHSAIPISAHTLKLNIIDENNGRFCCMRYNNAQWGQIYSIVIFVHHSTINFLKYSNYLEYL